jgi:hypothetical protein
LPPPVRCKVVLCNDIKKLLSVAGAPDTRDIKHKQTTPCRVAGSLGRDTSCSCIRLRLQPQ